MWSPCALVALVEWLEALRCMSYETLEGHYCQIISCAKMVLQQWNVWEVLHKCISFGASSSGKAPNDRGKIFGKLHQLHTRFGGIWLMRTRLLSGRLIRTGSRACKEIEQVPWLPHLMPPSNIFILCCKSAFLRALF